MVEISAAVDGAGRRGRSFRPEVEPHGNWRTRRREQWKDCLEGGGGRTIADLSRGLPCGGGGRTRVDLARDNF